jgi:hypothetical protein
MLYCSGSAVKPLQTASPPPKPLAASTRRVHYLSSSRHELRIFVVAPVAALLAAL